MIEAEIIAQLENKIKHKLFNFLNEDSINEHENGYILNKEGLVETLFLDGIKLNLSRIKNALKSLVALRSLNLVGCSIEEVDSISDLINLEYLNLSSNRITNINPLNNLQNLENLMLSSNNIDDLSGFTNLQKLTHLDVSGNSIKKIQSLNNFSSLTEIHISSNKIDNIASLKDIPQLEFLYAHDNPFVDISDIRDLKKIKGIYICQGNLIDISVVKELPELEDLFVNNNKIKDIRCLKKLTNLKRLSIAGNQLTHIDALRNLTKLTSLNVINNQIEELPIWITEFALDLRWASESPFLDGYIDLFDNPLKNPPIEIIKEGKEATKRYFKRIKKEGTAFINEAKLTLVGEGNAGKTSLQVRLMDSKKVLPKKDKRTRGIKIINWSFKRNHIVHIWDFGGQDVYYPVHRFFLTENSVFVLLASTRQTHHNFDYWIPTIYQFGGRSPIILGQTCHDGNKVPWNDLGYYLSNQNFNVIKTQASIYHELNLPKKNEGLQKIKQVIIDQILNLQHYGRGVPKSWIPVRNLLSERAKNTACISFEDFKETCRKSNSTSFKRQVDIEDCAKFLHSIGVVLWYYDNPILRDWVILQPEWAMNAVYKIIDDDAIQKRRGNILFKDFDRLWKEPCYDGKHNILKKMLEVFKIAFPKKHVQDDYIIPARLVSMPNELKWNNDDHYLTLEYQYEFMPKGMVNQVSAEMSRYITSDNEIWNNAVNFKNETNTAFCQVEEDFYSRKIYIKAKGKDGRDLIMLTMNAMKDITDGYKGVKPKIFVPCFCEKCKTNQGHTTFFYDDLIRWSEGKQNARVTCNESGESLSIESLLYNVGILTLEKSQKRIAERNRNSSKSPLKLFVAYSKYDEDYLADFQDHLITLKNEGLTSFDCRCIDFGEKWDSRIKEELVNCDVMVCLVSVKFLNTDYINKIEIPTAIESDKKIIPIIIKACDWENSSLGQYQAAQRGRVVSLDNNMKLLGIIKSYTEEERAAFWTQIIKEFRSKLFT